MLYAVICTDRADGLDLRLKNREGHIAFLRELGTRVKAAGPFLDSSGEKMTGSLLVLEAQDEAELKHILEQDPYAKANLFQSVDIRPWKWLINPPSS